MPLRIGEVLLGVNHWAVRWGKVLRRRSAACTLAVFDAACREGGGQRREGNSKERVGEIHVVESKVVEGSSLLKEK